MMRTPGWMALTVLMTPLAGCQPAGESTRNLVLTGSSTMAPLLRDVGKRFEANHRGVRIDVQAGDTDRGAQDTREGLADIGMASRPLKPEENHLHSFAFARDGVALIVHKTNPVTNLTDEQVMRIYTRAVSNWKQVGGEDVPITVVNQPANHPLQTLFLDHLKLTSAQVRADQTVAGADQAIRSVADNPGAIGYASLGRAEAAIREGAAIHLLPLGGVAATRANVASGVYPLRRPLYLVTRTMPEGLVREFLDFAQSEAVYDLIEKYHFVPSTR
jgi:phosphate transport system substrate-binding protein